MLGDKLNTLFDLAVYAAQHGMIWVGLDLYSGWHTADPAQSNVRTLPADRPQMTDGGADGSADLNRLGSWFGAMSQANSDQSPTMHHPRATLPPASTSVAAWPSWR